MRATYYASSGCISIPYPDGLILCQDIEIYAREGPKASSDGLNQEDKNKYVRPDTGVSWGLDQYRPFKADKIWNSTGNLI